MTPSTESEYRTYFRSMLLDFLENKLGIELPEKFVDVRSLYATKIYLSAIGTGDQPILALDKACRLLFKGFALQTADNS